MYIFFGKSLLLHQIIVIIIIAFIITITIIIIMYKSSTWSFSGWLRPCGGFPPLWHNWQHFPHCRFTTIISKNIHTTQSPSPIIVYILYNYNLHIKLLNELETALPANLVFEMLCSLKWQWMTLNSTSLPSGRENKQTPFPPWGQNTILCASFYPP